MTTLTPIEAEALERARAHAKSHEALAERFLGYWAGNDSWGERAREEALKAADLRTLIAALARTTAECGRMGKALEPFAAAWAALKDPLPQSPFTILVDANACAQAFRAVRTPAPLKTVDDGGKG